MNTNLPAVYSPDEVAQTLLSSFLHTFGYIDDEQKIKVAEFLLNCYQPTTLYSRLSPDQVTELRDQVFTEPVIRDFVMSWQLVFVGRFVQGRGQKVLECLIDDLALSLSPTFGFDSKSSDYNSLPEPVREALLSYDDAKGLLQANSWLVMIMLGQLYMDTEFLTPNEKQGKARN